MHAFTQIVIMHKLDPTQYALAQPLFAELMPIHLALAAVLAGTAPGEVYVNSLSHPHVAFARTYEGHFLAGEPDHRHDYAELKKIIPNYAYLIVQPAEWADHFSRVWVNRAARPHARQHLRLQTLHFTDYAAQLPTGFQLVPITAALLTRNDLKNHAALTDWVSSWPSTAAFLQHGGGFCVLHENCIASWCLSDCALGHRAEIGITTDPHFRRQGLASIAVAALVAHCLARGFTEIGWHCLSSNHGSLAVAQRIGFVKDVCYTAHSHTLPAENANDLTATEYADWAAHYEKHIPDNTRFALRAAEAWAMAGQRGSALANLVRFAASHTPIPSEWITDNWHLTSVQDAPEYEALLAKLQAEAAK